MSAALAQAVTSALQIPLQIPAKLLPILDPRQFKIMYGGRGGAKSHTVAQVLLAMGANRPLRILCVREVQKSLEESSMQLLKDYITRLGLASHYHDVKSEIRGWNGTKIAFSGLQDHTADSIKSFEGYDIVWVEEGQSVTARSYGILIPTIIRKTGAEIWVTLNLDEEEGYINQRFIVNTDPDAWVCQVNWRDNPWFNAAMNAERLKLKAANEDDYNHIWEGRCRSVAGLMFKRHWFKYYDQLPKNLSLYLSTDYACTDAEETTGEPDWTELAIWGLDEIGDLYAVDWWSGQTDPEEWIKAAIVLCRRHKPLMWFEEAGPITRSVKGALNRSLRAASVWVARQVLASSANKAAKATGFAARASAGAVWVPRNEPWTKRLVNQCCSFNGADGRVDDMVDNGSLIARGLDLMTDARPTPQPEAEPAEVLGTRKWLEATRGQQHMTEAAKRRFYR